MDEEALRRAMAGERSFLASLTRDYDRSVAYARAVLSQPLVRQYFVFHGVAMRLIPQSITHVPRVGIVGERGSRVAAAMEAEGGDERAAGKRLDEAEARARTLGAFDFLHKPVDITRLAARIAEARKRDRDEADD